MRQSRRRFRRIGALAAPWALAGALSLSWSAAGRDTRPRQHAPEPAFIAPAGGAQVASLDPDWRLAARAPTLQRAQRSPSLIAGAEIEPSPAIKADARAFPEIDRRLKGDLLIALRPTLTDLDPPPRGRAP